MAHKNAALAQGVAHNFPMDNIPPKQKEEKQFGLDIAKSVWGYASFNDTHLFYNDRDKYRKLKEYALGQQDEGQYKPLLGEDKGTNDIQWLKAVNFEIKNYATKRINIAVAKIFSKDYDVVIETVDPVSKGLQKNVERGLRLQMNQKKKLQEIDAVFGSQIDVSKIPKDEDELKIIMDNDFKIVEAMHLEMAIPYHLRANRFEDARKMVAFDLTVLGVCSYYVGMDENLKPIIERVNPADIITPYNDQPSFADLPYICRIKWVTIAQFRKMATGYIGETRIQEIIEEFGRRQHETSDYTSKYDSRRFDDVTKIALLHYNYRSTDTMVYLEKQDQHGNATAFEKPIDYYEKPKELERFEKKYGGSRKIHRMAMNAVYEGYWVIGSDDVFRHGRRAYSESSYGAFNNTGMGFKVYAPNAWDGMITSMGSQMIPNLDELQRYNLKVQQLVARAIPKGIGIDIFALRKANLKWGGKGMTDQQKIEMFMKSGLFVFSSKDRYAAGSNYKPFYEVENGLANDIEKYLRLIQNALIELDEIIGINKVTAGSNIREDAGKAVTELQVGATEVALDHLYKADKKVYQEVVEDLGILHIKSYKYSEANRFKYDQMFGQSGVAQSMMNFETFDFAFNIDVRPSDEEWLDIYRGAEKAYDKGIISYSDTLYLREFSSIKQARLWLMMKERQAVEAAKENSAAQIEANSKQNQEAITAKGEADQSLSDKQLANDILLEGEKRKTIEYAGQVEIGVKERIIAIQGTVDRRENAQEGKIKDRHIEEKGEIDTTIAAMSEYQKSTQSESEKPKKKNNDSN